MAGQQHSHCLLCRQVNCKQFADNVTSCEMTTCPNCAWRFHSCKNEEHALTCQESRVPCVNAGNGCPHLVKRSQIAQHLPVCPASVVSCAEEWCRWPMHDCEKGVRHTLPPSKTYIDCGQLDVGLAMRDQRMLIDSLKAPRRLIRSLRNPLTLKYPAVPLTHQSCSVDSDPGASGDTSQTVSDDETDTPWDLKAPHPGLKESIRRQLFEVPKETTDNLLTALNMASDDFSNKAAQDDVVANEDADCQSEFKKLIDDKEDTLAHDTNREYSRSSMSSERTRSRSVSVIRDVGGTQLHRVTGEKLVDGTDPEISLHKLLGVSLTYEVTKPLGKKHKSMYSFICAQNFRRDEYKWHYKNIHQDIHQGLQGWMEQRCPLAYLGCTFSFQRFIPEQPDVMLYHSWLQESFGIKSLAQPIYLPCDGDASSEPTTISDSKNSITPNTPSSPQHLESQNNKAGAVQPEMGPSISDLGSLDKQFDSLLTRPSNNVLNTTCLSNSSTPMDRKEDASSPSRSLSCCESERNSEERDLMVSVRPVVYTAANADSKVMFQYNVEEGQRRDRAMTSPGLTGLPFEILQFIAKWLDSFSLCNLSLTCRQLRDVCCSLLDDYGIVTLNWERQKTGDKISWKVANKRWMFSKSIEPIRAWKFNPNQPSVSEHLKTCSFNKDCNTHMGPQALMV